MIEDTARRAALRAEPRMHSHGKGVVLLVDWVPWSQNQNEPGTAEAILNAASAYGPIILARAYADWSRAGMRDAAVQLLHTALEPVLVLSEGGTRTALTRLTIEAVELAQQNPDAETFVISADEPEIGPLVSHLRSRGHVVVILAARVSPVPAPDILAPGTRPIGPEHQDRSFDIVFGWIRETLQREGYRGRLPFTTLGSHLASRYGFRVQEWFGPSMKFKTLLQMAEEAGAVKVNNDERDHEWAQLPASSETTTWRDSNATRAEVDDLWSGLTETDRESLLDFLREVVGGGLSDATLDDLASSIMNSFILPDLSFEQVFELLQEMAKAGILLSLGEDTEDELGKIYVLNEDHEALSTVLQPYLDRDQTELSMQSSSMRPEFAHLLPALADAKSMSRFGYFPAVQASLERRLGLPLKELGYPKVTAFFNEAMRLGIVRLWRAPDGSDLVLEANEPLPSPSEFQRAESLGEEWLPHVVRTVAACEDAMRCELMPGSISLQIKSAVESAGGPLISTNQASKLLKRDLVERGFVRSTTIQVPHRETRRPYFIPYFFLDRQHPEVQEMLADHAIELDPRFKLQCYQRL